MANPHFEIKITKRSKRQSAVAGAAYQSGENLFSEYDQKHKDYRKKEGVVYTEIMLPSHAPPEYADREQLWNAVEAVENQWNSQLARRFVLALPREVPEELYPQMVQDYCINLDLQDVKALVSLLRICSNNLNQYAKRANETGSIYEADINDLQVRLEEIWMDMKEVLVRLSSIQ